MGMVDPGKIPAMISLSSPSKVLRPVHRICQYTASIVCLRYKLDKYYQAIEKHPGPAYGDGFRYFRRALGKDNGKGMQAWIERVNVKSLPRTAPRVK